MYNLLVTAFDGAWDEPFYEYDKGRFLEYTYESIATALEGLTKEHIETLKSYPCLFAYEGEDDDVRIGYITKIEDKDRTLLIEFNFKKNIPPIPFSDIKPITSQLDIRDWEMNRTHWAVKDEDLFQILIEANILNENLVQTDVKHAKPVPQRNSNPRVTTVKGFIDKVLSLSRATSIESFYRGHSNKAKYKLEPSLFRKDNFGNYLYLNNEHILFRELLVSNSTDFSSDVFTLDKLVRMQHYSLPTRLLDITSNPLISLYFACKENSSMDGEVIIFSIERNLVKYFDSDTASCLANLARLPKNEKDAIDFKKTKSDFNLQISVNRLIHLIKEEKSFFEHNINPEDLRSIICVKSKMSNDRISSQSGAFLLFGLDAVLNEKGTTDIKVNRITVSNKEQILKELDLLNINESTVFPYIENSAIYVANKYKFKK